MQEQKSAYQQYLDAANENDFFAAHGSKLSKNFRPAQGAYLALEGEPVFVFHRDADPQRFAVILSSFSVSRDVFEKHGAKILLYALRTSTYTHRADGIVAAPYHRDAPSGDVLIGFVETAENITYAHAANRDYGSGRKVCDRFERVRAQAALSEEQTLPEKVYPE